MTAPQAGPGTEEFSSCDRRVLQAWAAGQADFAAYAAEVRRILAAAQAAHLDAVFDGQGEFRGLAADPGAVLPPGWRHNGRLAVPDPGLAAGGWVTMAIALAGCPRAPRQGLPGLPPVLLKDEEPPGWHAELAEDGAALRIGWQRDDQPLDWAKDDGRFAGEPDLRMWEPLPAAAAGGARR